MEKHIALDHVVDAYDRPFVVIGRDFAVVAINKVYEKAFQVRREEIEGKKCHEILHHRDRPCFEMGEECPYAQCFMTEQPCSCLHTHFDQEGRTRWVRIKLYPLRAADGSVYVGEMIEEIAARSELDEDDEDRPVGNSNIFLRTIEQLEQAAQSDAPVLLIGETGTGKELAASFIHRYSPRRKEPFVALDCTVVTESLFESEVFGHERGAFTGSAGAKEGLFEVADGGTLFIDEIGEATLNMQAKLLRVLELGEFRRVGGNKTINARARVVCATNRLLWDRVKSGDFREDLYYRIACFCIRIPSLRERLSDIPVLCEEILKRITYKTGRAYRLSDEALAYLSSYNYPGNIRELRNILQVAAAHSGDSPGGIITAEKIKQYLRMRDEFQIPKGAGNETEVRPEPGHQSLLPPSEQIPEPAVSTPVVQPDHSIARQPKKEWPSLKSVEAEHIAELLRFYGGNRRKIAQVMGVSERTLYRKLKKYGLRGIR